MLQSAVLRTGTVQNIDTFHVSVSLGCRTIWITISITMAITLQNSWTVNGLKLLQHARTYYYICTCVCLYVCVCLSACLCVCVRV